MEVGEVSLNLYPDESEVGIYTQGRRGARARARVVGLRVHTPTRTCGVGRSVWEYVKFGP